MGLNADLVNKVHDILVAAIEPDEALEYVEKVFFGGVGAHVQLAMPWICVILPQMPYVEEGWRGTGGLKKVLGAVEIIVCISEPDHVNPYGKSDTPAKRGILTLLDDVMNVLDNARDQVLSANGKIEDFNLAIAGHQKANDTKVWQGVIRMEFNARITAGGR